MPLSKCRCGHDAICAIGVSFAVEFDGSRIVAGKMAAYCNTLACNQRYWYYPKSGRITRRNSGPHSPYYKGTA